MTRFAVYLVLGGGLLGYLLSGLVPFSPIQGVAASGPAVRCGAVTTKGTACRRLVRIGGKCPFHGLVVAER